MRRCSLVCGFTASASDVGCYFFHQNWRGGFSGIPQLYLIFWNWFGLEAMKHCGYLGSLGWFPVPGPCSVTCPLC
ncbi:hypothetical protein F2Q68_00002442 [Brassica cretica]|uniref:Secreted protein n=2 Tax=Brassica cretica TaxID=69181 RepID=A0ABQ7BRC3_BRACR|nr:hypothetical protein F2Q68_00002442 [Brassica cretica]KAF3542439.1 hypothetical protein DY000_02003276 [Brassica cretica]